MQEKVKISLCIFSGCHWKSKSLIYDANIYIGNGLTKDICCFECKSKILDGNDVKAVLFDIPHGHCACIIETYSTAESENHYYAELSGADPGNFIEIFINIYSQS